MEPPQLVGVWEKEASHLSPWLHDWRALALSMYLKLPAEEQALRPKVGWSNQNRGANEHALRSPAPEVKSLSLFASSWTPELGHGRCTSSEAVGLPRATAA